MNTRVLCLTSSFTLGLGFILGWSCPIAFFPEVEKPLSVVESEEPLDLDIQTEVLLEFSEAACNLEKYSLCNSLSSDPYFCTWSYVIWTDPSSSVYRKNCALRTSSLVELESCFSREMK